MENNKLYVKFENLEDANKTIHTLFDTIEALMKYYADVGYGTLFEFIEQICLYTWGIYVGLVAKMKDFNDDKDNENKP